MLSSARAVAAEMSLPIDMVLALIVTCLLAWGVCSLAKWHRKRFLRIPYEVINEHRITPRFTVGSDCK
jgi:hypothetical protein